LTLIVRKDLREKYGLPEIKNMEDLYLFWDAVKSNENGIVPTVGMLEHNPSGKAFGYKPYFFSGLPKCVVIDMETMKAMNALETIEFRKACKVAHYWVVNGYVSKDDFFLKDFREPFKQGKAASVCGGPYEYNDLAKSISGISGAEAEFVKIQTATKIFQELTTWNFQSIAASSPHIERAVAYLNWVQKDQKNYDLLTLGVEGKHYKIKDSVVVFPDGIEASKPPYSSCEFVWMNSKYVRDKSTDVKGFNKILEDFDKDVSVRFKAMGFLFDPTPVKAEVAALEALSRDELMPGASGLIDIDEVLPEMLKKVKNAGIEKCVVEVQKQLDEFMKKQK
jgi:putative aldouronate transport system substrate-binding protein